MIPFSFEFDHNGYTYVLTDAGHTAKGRTVRYTKWNKLGQLVDTDYIQASSFDEAKNKIMNA